MSKGWATVAALALWLGPAPALAERGGLTAEGALAGDVTEVHAPYLQPGTSAAAPSPAPGLEAALRFAITHDLELGLFLGADLPRTLWHRDVRIHDPSGRAPDGLEGVLSQRYGAAWGGGLLRWYLWGFDLRLYAQLQGGAHRAAFAELAGFQLGPDGLARPYDLSLGDFGRTSLLLGGAAGLEYTFLDRWAAGLRLGADALLHPDARDLRGLAWLYAAYTWYP